MAAQQTSRGGLGREGVRALYGIPDDCHNSAYATMDKETCELAKPKNISDAYKIPKTKYRYRLHEGMYLPTEECTCSISHNCIHKPQGELDCRSLAPDPKKSGSTPKLYSGPRINTKIVKNLRELVQTVRYFAILANDLRSGVTASTLIYTYMKKWISDMKCFSMLLEILDASNILNVLHDFFLWMITDPIGRREVPQDIRYDLEWLKRKWQKGDWDLSDCLRGIKVDQSNLSRSLDKDWKFYEDWHKFGHNGLISGETWPYQIAIMRDGGHGAPEAGIFGIKGEGATSVVLSDPQNRKDYADIDEGYKVEYVSTASTKDDPTSSTQLLLESYEWRILSEKIKVEAEDKGKALKLKNRPIRLFRCFKLSRNNPWRPKSGFRYDGLYDITASNLIDPKRLVYRFTMQRRENQGEIRTDQPDNQMCTLYYQLAGVQTSAKRKYQSSSDYEGRNTRRRFRR